MERTKKSVKNAEKEIEPVKKVIGRSKKVVKNKDEECESKSNKKVIMQVGKEVIEILPQSRDPSRMTISIEFHK